MRRWLFVILGEEEEADELQKDFYQHLVLAVVCVPQNWLNTPWKTRQRKALGNGLI